MTSITTWKPAAVLALLFSVAVLAAHPGHEYHVKGAIAKVRSPHFEVKDTEGGITSFMIVPATEILVSGSRGVPSDIKVGVAAEVDGVEVNGAWWRPPRSS